VESHTARSQAILRLAMNSVMIAPTTRSGQYEVNDRIGSSQVTEMPSATSSSGNTQQAEASSDNVAANASNQTGVGALTPLSGDLSRMDFINEVLGIERIVTTSAAFGLRIHQERQWFAG
jgi:hypothetical protein